MSDRTTPSVSRLDAPPSVSLAPTTASLRSREVSFPSARIEPLLLKLHASTNLTQFWTALQALLRVCIPHDAIVAYLNFFDFASSWRAATILATPNAERPVTWFEGRRQVDMTPQFVLSQPQRVKIYQLSQIIRDPDDLKRTPFFQKYLAPGGWHYLAVALFWKRNSVSSEIAIRRTQQQGDFNREEIKLLGKLHSHLDVVIHRLITEQEERARRCWLEQFNEHLPFALLFINLESEVLYVNREGLHQCVAWNFGPKRARAFQARVVFKVPESIRQACVHLKEQWLTQPLSAESGARRQFSICVRHPKYPALTANITLQTETPCLAVKPMFMVHLSATADVSVQGSPLPVHSMLARLSDAERVIARRVVAGQSNDEISAELNKSIHTVKCQLTSIYKKVGVSSRSQLIARAHR